MIQVVHLFGFLPNMLELSMNPCFQGCTYCYAKTWKREDYPIEKVINDILRKEAKAEGLLPFLIRKRSPITISNRTDVMCAPDWRERLSAIKKLGFPVYLETKLNKDYKDLAQILNKKTDAVYQTVTGYNNKYEEGNILSAEEKLEAAKWLNKQGFMHTMAVNPYMPDKVTTDEIKKMINYVKPHGFVMRNYHTTSKTIHRHLFPPEYPKDPMDAALLEIRDYCRKTGVIHDIENFEDAPYPELNLRLRMNEKVWGNNSIVYQDFLIWLMGQFGDNDIMEVQFDDFCGFYEDQIRFFDGCIIKQSEYPLTNGASSLKWDKPAFDIRHFLKGLWNARRMNQIMDYWTDEKDKHGNLIYFREREGFVKHLKK